MIVCIISGQVGASAQYFTTADPSNGADAGKSIGGFAAPFFFSAFLINLSWEEFLQYILTILVSVHVWPPSE